MPDLIVISYKHNIINCLRSFLAFEASNNYFGENRISDFSSAKNFPLKIFFPGIRV